MNKIENYLNSLKPKEVIYLLVSIPIVVFIIYYNFISPMMDEKIQKLHKQEKTEQQKLIETSKKIRKLKHTSKTLLPTSKKLQNLKDDFKYIKYSLYSLSLLNLNENKIYNILSLLLKKSNELKLNISFQIKWNIKYPPFSQVLYIQMDGRGNYTNIIKYLQYIETMHTVNFISDIKISSDKTDTTLLKTFSKNKQFNNNSLSFILQKYSNSDLDFLKSIAKSKHLYLSTSVDTDNKDYLFIKFKGDKLSILNLYEFLKILKKRKTLIFSNLKINIHQVKQLQKNTTKTQQFNINLIIMGLK